MSDLSSLIVLSVISFALVWATGGYATKKLVLAMEGTREFGEGTTSRLRRVGGYAVFATWALLATLPASFLADWAVHGDRDAAFARLADRAEIVLLILEALGDD